MISRSRVSRAYAKTDATDSSRLKALLSLYDIALKACVDRDVGQLERSLDIFQKKLNFAVWPDLGIVLYAQYNRCRVMGREGDFIGAGKVLATLRKAWAKAVPAAESAGSRVSGLSRRHAAAR